MYRRARKSVMGGSRLVGGRGRRNGVYPYPYPGLEREMTPNHTTFTAHALRCEQCHTLGVGLPFAIRGSEAHTGGMIYTAVTAAPALGTRVIDPYNNRSGIVRAVLGNPRFVQVLCDDGIVRTMDTRNLVTRSAS